MRRFMVLVALAAAVLAPAAPGGTAEISPLDPARYDLIDLTHPLNASTVFWPTSPSGFEMKRLAYGETPGGYFYSANSIATPEHGGTHLDAPIHFSESGRTVERVPLKQLVAAAVVLDVSVQAKANPDYRASIQDIRDFESHHGRIPAGAIALLRTGWSRRYPDRKSYLGDDTPNDASHLHFPSFGVEAARMLIVERKVAALGVDTASIDYGPSADFPVHRLASAHNIPGLENLSSLERLPPKGALVIALPIKIEGGSGAPIRAIALVEKRAAARN
jgi:kynurenine formamidase